MAKFGTTKIYVCLFFILNVFQMSISISGTKMKKYLEMYSANIQNDKRNSQKENIVVFDL